jgi:hypothetical protein
MLVTRTLSALWRVLPEWAKVLSGMLINKLTVFQDGHEVFFSNLGKMFLKPDAGSSCL